jgi:hypothetical protein
MVHGVDLVGGDRHDHADLIAPAVPRVRGAEVPLGERLDVLCPASVVMFVTRPRTAE